MTWKILVADDDFDNRAIISASLEASGFRVLQAENGEEAIAAAVHGAPDLILMDLSMPRLSGWDAARRLKKIPETRDVPIFAFTAHALSGDAAKAKEAGCEDYVSKPCVPKQVVEKIRRRLGKSEEAL